MKPFLLYIATITLFLSCNSTGTPTSIVKADSVVKYPTHRFICFDKNGERKRGVKQIKLGDSLYYVISFLDLEISAVDSALKFESKKPIIKKGKHGICEIYVLTDFDKDKLMKSFEAVWIYKGDKSDASRSEFFNIVLNFSMACLWEETLNIYKEKDTLTIENSNNRMERFTTELRQDMWVTIYQSYTK